MTEANAPGQEPLAPKPATPAPATPAPATLANTSAPPAPPPPTPFVSLLVRSMGRPDLAGALASAAAQTHPRLEVVVVNASGAPHPPLPERCGPHALRRVDPGRPLPRAQAANAALDAARGEWLMFLDEDDRIDADHVARLVEAVRTAPPVPAAYAGVRLQRADGQARGTLDEPFDARRLWLANFLPIHAVLFARTLVERGCRFDPTFDLYEDWDFWMQATRHGAFRHVPGASATYRLVGASGAAGDAENARRAARRAFYRKWTARLSSDELEDVAVYAELERDASRSLRVELDHAAQRIVALDRERDAAARRGDALSGALDAARSAQTALEQQLRQTEEAARAQVAQRDEALRDSGAAYARLEADYHAVTQSFSWRVTAPLRRVRAALSRDGLRRAWQRLPLPPAHKQGIKRALVATPLGARLRGTAQPADGPAAAARPGPPLDKDAVREQAERDLGALLDSDARIVLAASPQPRVSVIAVMFNQAGLTALCLQALARTEGVAYETLLVDNGSTDRVPDLLERVDGATVLRPGENLGFLRAVNRAAQQARGEFLLLLNNDALVEPETLARAVARLDAEPGADAAGGPILLWDGRLQEAGSIVWQNGACLGYGRGDDPARPEYAFVRDVDYCSGALLLIRRQRFEQLGGFDDAYAPAYYEESDFCVRLWEAGRRVVYDPAVRVRHFEFASETGSGQALALQARNRERFVARHAAFLAGQLQPAAAATPGVLRARQRVAPGKLRVLVVDDRVPLPWLGRGYPRAAELLAALAADRHAVTHYPLLFAHEDAHAIARVVPERVEVMTGHGEAGLAAFLRARRGVYDRIIVSRPHNMRLVRQAAGNLRDWLGNTRLVYDAEAVFALRDAELARLRGAPWPSAELDRRVAEEVTLAEGAQAVCTVSAAEAQPFERQGLRVHVVGHTLAVDRRTPGFDARSGFVFVGAMPEDNTPNTDSVLWFVREVWPLVRAALGDRATLRLIGVADAPSIQALRAPGLAVLGTVDALAPHLDAARVFIVPTRYAAGIPHKAHEAAARGLPMVTTALIAEQLGWVDRVPIGIDAASFAAACVRLHEDRSHWDATRTAVLDGVARDCAPDAFGAALRAALAA